MKYVAALMLALSTLLSGCNESQSPQAVTFSGKIDDIYRGKVTVALTNKEVAGERIKLRNIFPNTETRVLAMILVENAKVGMKVRGEWTRLATLQPNTPEQTPTGIIIGTADFTLNQDSINAETSIGTGKLQLLSTKRLPADSYQLRVFIDDQLVRTAGFVLVPVTQNSATNNSSPTSSPTQPIATDSKRQ